MSTTLKPRTASIVIYQGDDMATLSELHRAAETAARIEAHNEGSALRLGDAQDSGARDAQAAYDAFVDEAAGRALVIEVQAIGRRRFRDLMSEHPPRKVTVKDPAVGDAPAVEREEDHPDDAAFGVNIETFPDALLAFIDGDTRTIVAPDFPTRKAVTDFLDDDLAEGDYDHLWVTAYYLNRSQSADPKAARFSTAHRSITGT